MRIIEKSNSPMQFMLWIFKDTLEIKFQKKLRLQKVKERKSFFIRHTEEINFPFIEQTRRESMELSIQERLKDLRVERGLTLEQLAEQTHLSKSALGSYEGDKFKDISHYALIELAKFYEVTVDYLLGRSVTKNQPNTDLADLHLSDDMMADLEIYVNGAAVKQVQTVNAIVDTMSATIMKQYNPGLTDPQLRQLLPLCDKQDSPRPAGSP